MPRPAELKTRIFLDSGDPEQTKEMLSILGFLDGQTTNPSLVAKNPELQEKIAGGAVLSADDVNNFYKQVVQDIASQIPDGSVSVEVYADKDTPADTILAQAREMNSWIPNAHIKFPTIPAGLQAAEQFIAEDHGRVNMTLVFSDGQAAAVHAATKGAKRGDVFLSPFVGRLDDKGVNGMSLIHNVQTLYAAQKSHVEVLVASIRNLDHFMASLAVGADIVTVPFKILKEWADAGMPLPDDSYVYDKKELGDITAAELDLSEAWQSFSIQHDLTDAGLQRFADDWNKLIGA